MYKRQPQGSVLGPLLFSLYVNDVLRQPGVQVAFFADDTAVFTADGHVERAVFRLQRQLDSLGDWTENWRVQLNATKSVAVNSRSDGRTLLGSYVSAERTCAGPTRSSTSDYTCLLYTSRCV